MSVKQLKRNSKPTEETQITVASGFYQGPIPPPSILHQYNQIVPGAADRIILMAEAEQKNRHKLESRALNYAGGLSYFFIFVAFVASIFNPWGLIIGLGAFVPLIAEFLKK